MPLIKVRPMVTPLRRTGIDEIGDRPWGTHFCVFYESAVDLLDLNLGLPPSLDTAIYRVVQSALTNVARHARARHVTVIVRRGGLELELLIHDDGVGFDVAAALARARQGTTLGLLSMHERVRLAG